MTPHLFRQSLKTARRQNAWLFAILVAITVAIGAAGPAQATPPLSTTTTLTADPNPSVYGESVTLNAVVSAAPDPTTPTGTVGFYDGAMLLGTASVDATGEADFTVSSLEVGSNAIVAVYSGDAECAGSTSPVSTQTVEQASTSTLLTSSPNPSVLGQYVTFTATVAPVAPGSGTPTGVVDFFDGATLLGTATVDGTGEASLTTSSLEIGTHSIAAVYSGDDNCEGSTSGVASQTVASCTTTTTVTSSPNPSVYGQSVAFTATVSVAAPGSGTPTGTVSFFDGATLLGAAILDGSGTASFTTNTLGIGSHAITAVYGGDSNCTGNTSPVSMQTVNQASTTTTVTSSPNPSVYGQSATITATVAVAAPGSGTPTGSVSFFDGATLIGTMTLDGTGQASFATSSLARGPHSITAVYSGDAGYTSGPGSFAVQMVNPASTTTSVTSSANPSNFGDPVTFTATVTAVAPGSGTPTGTVSFNTIEGPPLTGVLDADGVATVTTAPGFLGPNSVEADYSGDDDFSASSDSMTQTVNIPTPTITTLTSSSFPSVAGQPITLTATLINADGGGTVQFTIDGTPVGSPVALTGTTATYDVPSLAVGTHSITASYSGDALSGPSGGNLTQIVNPADTTTMVASSANPSSLGAPVTFTVTVAPVAPGAGTPTGSVTVFYDTWLLGTATLNGAGQATITTSALSVGSHRIDVDYSGDSNFNASSSDPTMEDVNAGAATHFIVLAPSTAAAGHAFSVTVTALNAMGLAATGYTGTVRLTSTDGQAVLPEDAALVNGVGQFTVTLKTAGTQTLTATDTAASNVTSVSNDVAVGAASTDHIAFTQQPTTTVPGVAIAPAPSVTVTDKFGNPVATASVTISLAAGTGSIIGTQTQNTDANGIATFPGLALSKPGQKTLQAKTPYELAAASNPFTVTADDHLTAQGAAISAVERVSFTGHVATATDTDKTSPASDFTATIDWGDGKTSAGTVSGSGGSFTIAGTHTYAAAGTYTVKTTLTDIQPGGPTAQATSTAIVKDVTAPITTIALSPTAPASGGAYAAPVTVTLAATDPDDAASAIATFYTVDGGAQQAYSKPFTIGGNGAHTVRYFSKDAAGNTEAAKSTSFAIKLPPAVLHTFPQGLQLFSVPEDFSGIALGTALSRANPSLAVWVPDQLQYAMSPSAPADALRPGQGYWARFGQATDLFDLGSPTPTARPFAIALKKGWNMIGDPFPSAVSLSAISVTDGVGHSYGFNAANHAALVSLTTYSYPAGAAEYQSQDANGSLAPYAGYWIYAFTDCTLEVPAP